MARRGIDFNRGRRKYAPCSEYFPPWGIITHAEGRMDMPLRNILLVVHEAARKYRERRKRK